MDTNQKVSIPVFTSFMVMLLLTFGLRGFSQPRLAEERIAELMKQADMAGLSVAVVKDGRIVYTHSFGYKHVESNTPLTTDCMFRIASISKSFTATAIMQLVEAKKLSLNDDVSNLIGFKVRNPKFPDQPITLRMILSHRSGINDRQGYFTLDAINPDKNPDWEKCYNDYAPGSRYQYCNLNFNMAGTIIERISGERFDQYIKQHILDPLGLYGGYCIDSLDALRFATLYEYRDDSAGFVASPNAYAARSAEVSNYTMGYSAPIFSPTGGMKITAADLAKYMTMHMNYGRYNGQRIIKRKSARLMQKAFPDSKYGLAIMTRDSLIVGKVLKGHTGSAYGLYSTMFFDPKGKFGIVAITNGCRMGARALNGVVNCLYEHFIRE